MVNTWQGWNQAPYQVAVLTERSANLSSQARSYTILSAQNDLLCQLELLATQAGGGTQHNLLNISKSTI